MKKAFTLVELLVVISIISMLSSVVIANVESARAKSRDAVREQQIRQIDLATQMYIQEKGHAPDMKGLCKAQTDTITADAASACFAVSTAAVNTDGYRAWQAFTEDIAPYIDEVPTDPCPTCDSSFGYLGYTYVAPLALQYQCIENNNGDCPLSDETFDDMYGLYAPLEDGDDVSGDSGSESGADDLSDSFNDGNNVFVDTTPPVISNVQYVSGYDSIPHKGYVTVTWDTDELSDSYIDYGLNNPRVLNKNAYSSTMTLHHSLTVGNLYLSPDSYGIYKYYFKIRSTNTAGLLTVYTGTPSSVDMPVFQ